MESYKRCWLLHSLPRKLRGNLLHWSCRRERSVHNLLKPIGRTVWGLIHLKVTMLWRNPMHCFHRSRETWSGVLCSETLTFRIWEGLFLKVTRITCSIRQDQTWRSKNFTSSPSINASVNYNDKRKSKDWRYRTHDTDLLNLDENKFDCKKNYLWKKTFSEIPISEICTKESARTSSGWSLSEKGHRKSRDNSTAHFPIAANARTSVFYEWFWRFARCRIKFLWKIVSRVQSTCDDSEFSLFAQPRQKIVAWHMESIWITRKRLLKINFLRLIQPEIDLKEFNLTTCRETEKQSLKKEGRRPFTQVKTD